MDLFIPITNNLEKLANYLKLSNEDLIKKIENGFSFLKLDLYPDEDAGKPFRELLEESTTTIPVFACFYLKRSDKFINELLADLYFKNTLEDCDYCGCETTIEYDYSDKGQGEEIKSCSNCNEKISEVTNWDKEVKGLDY